MGGALTSFLLSIGFIYEASDFANLEYQDAAGNNLLAYIAYPNGYNSSDTNVRYPAAIVMHAWNGLSDLPVYFADRMAEEGFIAIAPDNFRGIGADTTNVLWNTYNINTRTPQSQIDNDMDATIQWLIDETTVDPSKIFAGPGFCFGGSQALELSARRPVAATVTLYGSSISELQDPTSDNWGLIGNNGTKVLGLYGSEDNLVPVADAEGFRDAMEARGIDATVIIYQGADHSFVDEEDHANGVLLAVNGWNEIVNFMKEVADDESRMLSTPFENEIELHGQLSQSSTDWDVSFRHMMDFVLGKGHANHIHHHRPGDTSKKLRMSVDGRQQSGHITSSDVNPEIVQDTYEGA